MAVLVDTCGWTRQYNATLITADDHFEGLPDVIYFPKKKGTSA